MISCRLRFAQYVVGAAIAVASCSKSPIESTVNEATTVARNAMQPLVQADASAQAVRMIDLVVSNKPECEIYKARMREVGKRSPYEATTQRGFVQTQQDACKAGCCKPYPVQQ
jgi:hypothetical protein